MGKSTDIIVIKIGGSTLGQHDTTLEDIVTLQKQGISIAVVHGGGKIITDWLSKLGATSRFVMGERVTDLTGLQVVTAVLAGLVNKELVASINCLGGRAIGISGVDGALFQAKIKSPELGYTGEITGVNVETLKILLASGFVPVISPVSINYFEKTITSPLLLNVNADMAAGELAVAVGASKLIFLTDVAGISDKSGKVRQSLTPEQAEDLISSGAASGGMIPKIRAGIRALQGKGVVRIIDGRLPHALLNELSDSKSGTTIQMK